MVGIPRSDLAPFKGTIEFLSHTAECTPSYVSPEEITDLEREFSAEGVADAVRRLEFARFLGGRDRDASWLLFSPCGHSMVVRRAAVEAVGKKVQARTHQIIYLPYMIGTGATTIARNVLYEVRKQFVCLVLNQTIGTAAVEAVKGLLQTMGKKTGLPVLILVDCGLNKQGIDSLVRGQLMRTGVYFLCPYRDAQRDREEPKGDEAHKSQTSIPLSSGLSDEEKDLFHALLPRDGHEITLSDGTSLTPYLTPQGNFKSGVHTLKGWKQVQDRLAAHSNEQLLQIGLSAPNVVALRNYQLQLRRNGKSAVFQSRRDSSLPPVLYGLFGFDETYAERAGEFLLGVMVDLYGFELEIVKLCCFLSIFAPPVNLPLKVALFIQGRRSRWANRSVVWSDQLLALVEVLEGAEVEMSVRTLPVAYKIAESSRVFGPRPQWSHSVPSYIRESLFAMFDNNFPFRGELMAALGPALRQAFVDFKIWHPPKTIDPTKADKALSYSFLIRLMLFGGKDSVVDAKKFMRMLMNSMEDPDKLYATHCARLLTGQGELNNNFADLLDAEEILLRNNAPEQAVVCDRLGHVYKAHLRVLLSLFKAVPPAAHLTLGDDEHTVDGTGFLRKRTGHSKFYAASSAQPARISFEVICNTAWEADRYFGLAVQKSGGAYPNPMVGAAQTWEAVLNIVRYALCDRSDDLFRRCYAGAPQHATLPEVFRKLRSLQVEECCSDYLHVARKAMRYKAKGEQSQEHSFASHTHDATQDKIAKLKKSIDKCFQVDTPPRTLTAFSVSTAKHWMVWEDRYSALSCDKLCYSLLTFADAFFPAAKKSRPAFSQFRSDQRLVVCMELLFSAGCSLTSDRFGPVEVGESLTFFISKLRPGIRSQLEYDLFEPKIANWIDQSKKGGSFGLGARLGMVALLLEHIVLQGADNAFAKLAEQIRALDEDGAKYLYRNKPRLFLAKARKSTIVPFSCFYFPEDLPFASELKGRDYRQREEVFSSDTAREYLWEFSGTVAVLSGKKGNFVINCPALRLTDLFCFADDCVLQLSANMPVTFVLGIRDGGLVALGLRQARAPTTG